MRTKDFLLNTLSTEYRHFNSNMVLNNIPFVGKFIRDFKNYAKGYSNYTTTIDNPHLIVNIFLNKLTSIFNTGVLDSKDKIDLTLGYRKYIINVDSVKFKDEAKLKLAKLDVKLYRSTIEKIIIEEICKKIPERNMNKEELNGVLAWNPDKVKDEIQKALDTKESKFEKLQIENSLQNEWNKIYDEIVDSSFKLLEYLEDNIQRMK